MCSRSARIASAAKPSPEPKVSRKCFGKCSDGTTNVPRLDERGDDLVVHLVAVVDDVDAELDRHHDRPLVDEVAADQRAALMGGVDRRAQLRLRHLDLILRRGGAVASGHEQLDHVGAPLDLLADAEAERVGAVAEVDRARRLHAPVPRHAVVAVPGGGELARRRPHPGPGDQAVLDRPLHARLHLVRATGADDARVAVGERGLEVPRCDHRQVRRRVLVAVRRVRLRPELVVGGVEVAGEQARHQRAAGQVVRLVDGLRQGAGRDLDDALTIDHDGHVVDRRSLAVDQPSAGQGERAMRASRSRRFRRRIPIRYERRPSRRAVSRRRRAAPWACASSAPRACGDG